MIIIELLLKYWREVTITILLGVIYTYIFHQGYNHCEAEVKAATDRAVAKDHIEQQNKQNQVQSVADNMESLDEIADRNRILEEKLNALHNKNSTKSDCIIESDAVRLYNSAGKE